MKKLVIALMLASLIAGCVQMSAEEIAKKMQEKEEQIEDLRAEVLAVTESPLGEFKQSYTYVFKKPYKIYMESENFITVSNGSVMWSYDKINNKVMVLESNFSNREPIKLDYTEIIKDLLERYDVQLLGEEKVSGRDCYVLNLKPKGDEGNVTKMWVDKEFWFPVKMEYKFGEFSMFIEYRNLSFNNGIDDSFFEFKPPERC
ncbi:MAG: outer membrane lipoprotein carrier protein LolA [Archaeoglobus sp.]|uniref:LolA family protein n=1 Tax=Archaeoglobus sp. TaxID=1872626 RepID=UPI001DB405C3|nr:outer membrane lipoprotein carrier protein LolA [Archaeoglobus sp.]MBO8180123.1 outer membrane lipoprotein carrier protein LolA [Archaeoglobus sp.]